MISVLMSVYNESLNEIHQSIDSILSQSYNDFEVIIVLDQPDYKEGFELLKKYTENDSRIHLLVNENNIGLAMSMNRAAEHAKGEYLLRMDADDVCLPNRFKMEYDLIRSGKYDLVCGNYEFIDEGGDVLSINEKIYSDYQLNVLLPYRNVIHHPTVIMTKRIFDEVGGYRNYLCAQDYDLWLRFKCKGARMHMIPERIIQYRIRTKSTTAQKRYKQACTLEYIRNLYRNGKMKGYSYDGYLQYLEQHSANSQIANADYLENFNRYTDSKRKLKRGNLIGGMKDLCYVLFKSKYYHPHIIRNLKIAILMHSKKK